MTNWEPYPRGTDMGQYIEQSFDAHERNEPGLLDANYNGDIVETLRQIDLMLRNRMGAIEPLLSQVIAQLADLKYQELALLHGTIVDTKVQLFTINQKLDRLEPLIEYAEQLVEQRARISKWIPGKK